MSDFTRKHSVRAQARQSATAIDALNDRVGQMESSYINLVQGLDGLFKERDQQHMVLSETLNAVIALVGADKVAAEMTRVRSERSERQAAEARAALDVAISNGVAKPAEVIGDLSLIVADQFGADGLPLLPARMQVTLDRLIPSLKEQLLGKGAGTEAVTAEGNRLVVVEIYDIDEELQTKLNQEAAQKAADEAAALSQADAATDKAEASVAVEQ